MVEWYWQPNTEVLTVKPVPVSLRPPHVRRSEPGTYDERQATNHMSHSTTLRMYSLVAEYNLLEVPAASTFHPEDGGSSYIRKLLMGYALRLFNT